MDFVLINIIYSIILLALLCINIIFKMFPFLLLFDHRIEVQRKVVELMGF